MAPTGIELRLRAGLGAGELLPSSDPAWIADPLAIDGVFQALILWSREFLGAPSLPARVGAYRRFGGSTPAARLRVAVRESSSSEVVADADLLDAEGLLVARLEACVSTVSAGLERAFVEPATRPEARSA
jgi:hypothetical protein